MSKALLESTTRKPAPQPEPEDAGYEPHEWERKLAAARQKREAVLLQRAASRDAPGTEPIASENPRDRPTAIESFVAKVQSAGPRSPRDADNAGDVTPGARGWRSRFPTFVAGCAFGAMIVGLLAMTIGSRSASGPSADNGVAQAAPTLAVMTPASEPSPLVARPDPSLRDEVVDPKAAAVEPPADSSVHAAGISIAATPVPGAAEAAVGRPPAGSSLHEASAEIAAASAYAVPSSAGTADDRTGQVAGASEPVDAARSLDEMATAPRPAARPAPASLAVADIPAPGAGWVDLASATPIAATSKTVSPLAASTSRIVVLAPRSVPAAASDEAVSALREFGWPAGEPRVSPFTISRTHVRFYHPEDRAAAEDLAAMFSAEARDFTDYARRPERGMLELWMAGRAPVRRHQPARPALPPPVQMVADALGRLAKEAERLR